MLKLTVLSLALVDALVITLLLATASTSLPGSALYDVKVASERAWLWLRPWNDKGAWQVQLANRRLDEFLALLDRGTFRPDLLVSLGQHGEAALRYADTMPSMRAAQLLEEVVVSAARWEAALGEACQGLDAAQRSEVEEAIEACRWNVGAALSRGYRTEPGFVPGIVTPAATRTRVPRPTFVLAAPTARVVARTATTTPTGTAATMATATATPTPTPTATPTATRTATPTATASATRTARPVATRTPPPSPTATATPTPVPSPTLRPSDTPVPTTAPVPTSPPEPTAEPTETSIPWPPPNTPIPRHTPEPTNTPEPLPVLDRSRDPHRVNSQTAKE